MLNLDKLGDTIEVKYTDDESYEIRYISDE